MKEKRIDFNYKPLSITATLEPSDSVPARQSYNAMMYDEDSSSFIAGYTPDYTVTPLILLPQISIFDKDGVLSNGNVNSSLTDIAWYEIIDGVSTQILATDSDYDIISSGDNKGQLTIKRNFDPSKPATFEFHCSYVDSRTKQTISKILTYLVRCVDETSLQPTVEFDTPEQKLWNPFIDEDEQVITARLMLNGEEIPAEKRVFVWEELRSSGGYTEIGTDNADGDVTIADDTASVTVNRRLMGSGITIRCRAKYDPTGTDPSSVTLSIVSPVSYFTIRRYIPPFDEDMVGIPFNIPPGTEFLYPEAKVKTVNGEIIDWIQELEALWYMATNNSSASLTYSLVGQGVSPEISTKLMNSSYGAVIKLDVKDRGPLCAWADSDGYVLTDEDGDVIMFN